MVIPLALEGGLIRERSLQAVFFDLADTLAYLWVPKSQRFPFLCKMAGLVASSDAAAEAGRLTFLRTWSGEEPGPVEGSLGWRGGLGAYRAGLVAMGCEDADAGAKVLADAARRLPFSIYPDPGAAHLLALLKQHGLRLGVLSNHRGTLRENLLALDLLPYCDVVLDSHLTGIRKPDPEIFLMACEAAHVPPDKAAFVGGEPLSDVAGARQADLLPILLDPAGIFPPPNGAEVTVASLSDLKRVFF